MKLYMFSVYDTVAEIFNKPFTEVNDATAIRAFVQSIADNPHKNDYILYRIATYTDHDGAIVAENPHKLRSGFDVQKADVVEIPSNLQEQAQ